MSTLEILAMLIIVVVILVWRITWLAGRVHRATMRAERTWSALDAALVGRAQRAAELVMMPGIDPATALLVLDAAAAALEPDLCQGDRERAESDLSHVLDAVDPMLPASPRELASERARASICSQAAQRCRGDSPFHSPPIYRANLAVGGAHPRAASVRNGGWFDLHSDGWPAGFASFVARVRARGRPRSRAASSCSRRSWPTVIVHGGRELGWPCE